MNKVFLTFGNRKFYGALKRITKQALDFNYFNYIIVHNEYSIQKLPNYKEIFPLLTSGRRGYGYYTWKSFIIRDQLKKLNYGDILFYIDAGCYLDKRFLNVLEDLVKNLNTDLYDNIAIQYKSPEKQYTKMDTLIALGANNPKIMNSDQLLSGIMIFKKTPEIEELIEKAYHFSLNIHLTNDSPSIIPNDPIFKENRHDQSIFSILRKQHNKTFIIDDFTYSPHNWELCKFPFQARRLRN
jgi:hypothetical protein